jgi:photosystem II stability/assembly factor-like uncharacterized protein
VTPRNSSGEQVGTSVVVGLTSLIAWGATATNIYLTIDGGQTWKDMTIPAVAQTISFINPRDGWLLAPLGSYTGHTEVDIYRSIDAGETWIKVANNMAQTSGLTNLSGIRGFAFVDSTTGWITGFSIPSNWLYLFVTHDGGRTWREQKLPLLPQLTHWIGDIAPPTFFAGREGILPVFFGVLNESLHPTDEEVAVFYATRDGGTTWTYTTPLSFRQANEHVSSFADMDHGWVTDGDALWATTDGGRVWTKVLATAPFVDVKQLQFISRQIGWAVSRTYPWLLKTMDGGRTWAALTYSIERQ